MNRTLIGKLINFFARGAIALIVLLAGNAHGAAEPKKQITPPSERWRQEAREAWRIGKKWGLSPEAIGIIQNHLKLLAPAALKIINEDTSDQSYYRVKIFDRESHLIQESKELYAGPTALTSETEEVVYIPVQQVIIQLFIKTRWEATLRVIQSLSFSASELKKTTKLLINTNRQIQVIFGI